MDIAANCNQKVIKNGNHILHSFIYCVRYGKQRLNETKLIWESHLKFYQTHFLQAFSCFYLTISNIKFTSQIYWHFVCKQGHAHQEKGAPGLALVSPLKHTGILYGQKSLPVKSTITFYRNKELCWIKKYCQYFQE